MNDEKRMRIAEELVDIFDRINIDTPNNFDDVLDFVVEDVKEKRKRRKRDSDVAIAFRRWIESNQKEV